MASFLQVIKNLPNISGNSISELLRYFIYGQRFIPEYDRSERYNMEDFVTVSNPETGEIFVFVCNSNNVTGSWDETKWDPADVNSMLNTLTQHMVEISTTKPTHRHNRFWVQPISKREMNIIQPPEAFDFTSIQVVFEDEFMVVEDTQSIEPTQLNFNEEDLLFDYEGTASKFDPNKEYHSGDIVYNIDPGCGSILEYRYCGEGTNGPCGNWNPDEWECVNADVGDDVMVFIKTQDDITIQPIQPTDDETLIWIDTDLSDD